MWDNMCARSRKVIGFIARTCSSRHVIVIKACWFMFDLCLRKQRTEVSNHVITSVTVEEIVLKKLELVEDADDDEDS